MTNRVLDPLCLNVLVIEDDQGIREAIMEVLSYEGYEVRTAPNGAEGMNMLEVLPGPTLVLLDMMMPVMNGWQFLAAQRSRTKFADISVVVVSAMPEDRALLGANGALPVEGMLRKPINVDSLLGVVEKYCVRRNEPGGERSA